MKGTDIMDKLGEKNAKIQDDSKKESFFSKIGAIFNSEKQKRREDGRALAYDLILFSLGFIFSRCHLLFGARPLGIALVAALSFGVWPTLFGVAIGALMLGIDGIAFAGAAAIVVFLRAAISAGGKGESINDVLFRETILLRMCTAILGGFLTAIYEALASGLDESSLLFGLSMIILPPLLVFIFSGCFSSGFTVEKLFESQADILSFSGKGEREKYNIMFFQMSSLALLFFVSLALREVSIFGISFSYLFAAVITLLVAKRFGALRALATGFVTTLGISGTLSVSFALAGLAAGVMFGFGTGYALIAGGVALAAWSAYSSSLTGFLSTLPEYVIAASISLPLLKRIEKEVKEEVVTAPDKTSEDMVGTMALAYQNRYSGSLDALEMALTSLSSIIRGYLRCGTGLLTHGEYRCAVISVAERYCRECSGASLCSKEGIRPCIKNADKIAAKLACGEKITGGDVNTDTEFCQLADEIAESISREVALREEESYRLGGSDCVADEYELIARLINSARASDEAERAVDDSLTDTLGELFREHGFENGTIRVFGERRRHFILAGEDADGSKIASKELRRDIEAALGVKLATPEYFRRDKMVLMECGIRRAFSVEIATAALAGKSGEISGDSIAAFESGDDRFFALISDGMGSGEVARETSEFVTKFMRPSLGIGAAKETVLHMLNHAIRNQKEECSATVDLFELDLLTGEAVFIKSGAAPSYVKRESSIFRIRSQTAPIGLLSSIDTEKIKVEVRPGDYVIMLSDGIADSMEDAPWLLVMLGEPAKKNPKEYAEAILEEAKKNAKTGDDMSVVVIKIDEI